jgi:mevalonate kinase
LEKISHGNPSGIDNTVVTYEKPLRFASGEESETVACSGRFFFAVVDSGHRFPTSEAVERVRRWKETHPLRFEELCRGASNVGAEALRALKDGETAALAEAMNKNHQLLVEVGVSSPILEGLVAAALDAGAVGAKLTGAGVGGSVIALLPDLSQQAVLSAALVSAGARDVYFTEIGGD